MHHLAEERHTSFVCQELSQFVRRRALSQERGVHSPLSQKRRGASLAEKRLGAGPLPEEWRLALLLPVERVVVVIDQLADAAFGEREGPGGGGRGGVELIAAGGIESDVVAAAVDVVTGFALAARVTHRCHRRARTRLVVVVVAMMCRRSVSGRCDC